MKILTKLLKIFFYGVCAVVVLYFFCALIVIPVGAPWVIRSQGSKILKHPVKVRAVTFNPFLWRLGIADLRVVDSAGQKLIGFERLSIDVSFLSLIKKVIRIEFVRLDGLFVHVSLKENGRINILDLVPVLPAVASGQPVLPNVQKKSSSLPEVFVDDILVRQGRIEFNDDTVKPTFKTVLSDIDISVENFSTQRDKIAAVTLKAILDHKGNIHAMAQLKPFAQPLDIDVTFDLGQYVLTAVSPYVGKYTGRQLSDGRLDFSTAYRISQNRLTASHNVLIERFTFGEKVESKDALDLPFGFAVALLEDPQGRIKISLPVSGDISDPKFEYSSLVWQTVRNFFIKLVTKPFMVLSSILGSDSGTEELGSVKFLPGKAQLSTEEKAKIALLAKSLKDRPKLLLEINGNYDLTSDWKAIKTQSFLKEYEVLRKESSRDEYWVLQTIYQRHFGIRQLWKLSEPFKIRGGYDYEKLNLEIRRQLSEDAFPDKKALNALACARAQAVYDAVIQEQLDPRRVRIGGNQEVLASLGFVPLNFVLTIFDQSADVNLAVGQGISDNTTKTK